MLNQAFTELEQLETVIQQLGDRARVETVGLIPFKAREFPIYSIVMGSMRSDVPVLAFFGGVHGLEKIGSEVILSYLQTIIQLLDWDEEFAQRLERSRLVFMPIVNPVGVFRGTRCNANGVDLMRNAPIEGSGNTKLYSGHRLSPRLPWYRGDGSQMEAEAQALCQVVQRHVTNAPLSIALDLHSGFGIHDRLWFPYASRKQPFPDIAEAHALKSLFDRCYPNHFYKIEPMSQEYVINGDLWDYLYDSFSQSDNRQGLFLPLTLEMGSWLWLRKSPLHLFQRHGLFHPLLPHRQQRILRRHFTLFDFLYRSLLYPAKWSRLDSGQLNMNRQQALALWYA
ncbi:zinc carboxypeptidase [Methylomonas sp. LL1]|uniref:M14 family zinc carboxypeptidase n=1 Tax=Methylomonas sp. LL1 TaxID=2785785 RepID=UPI0018C3AADE|nr:M14 family zinc carboxypeptidase [Methylomonas sp. LL1]QPK64149.1 zinc carboxypeptidase [Methylomonas sp. LL1]